MALLASALVGSMIAMALATGRSGVTLGFAAGVMGLGAVLWLALRREPGAAEGGFASPDWSVTVAAIDRSDCALAITDRAGRLVCANALYQAAFGVAEAPPRVELAEAAQDRLAQAARLAWRDGAAALERVAREDDPDGAGWQVALERAGRADDFLIWRFTPITILDPLADLEQHIAGKLGRALAQAGFAAVIVDAQGAIRAASSGFALRATGDEKASMAGSEFVACLVQDDHDRIFWARDSRRTEPLILYYLPVVDPDLANPPGPENGGSSLILVVEAGAGVGVGSDVGSSVPHLEALLAQLPLGLAMTDRDGRMLFANAAFMRAAGHEGAAPPTYPTDLVVKEDKAALSDAVRRFGQGAATAGDVAIRLAAQPDEPVSLSLAGMRGLGEAAVLLGLTDSTEEARLKRQIAQATKMQAVGQLAGGVAHYFNNVLTAIIGTCDLMLLRHTPGDSDYDEIQHIRASSNRDAMLEQAVKIGRDGSGRLSLATRRVSAADVRAMRSEIIPIADYTALIVEDTGAGIPPEHLGKIWEPFFTTKEHGKGTGLGLSTVYGIVKQSGGFIFADSELATPGKPGGTRFTIYLPVHHGAPGEAVALAKPREEAASWAGGGDILLVEDEDSVRLVAERALTRAGYSVTSASDGDDGLEQLRVRLDGGGTFDLVLSDVVMPAMDGPAMARALRLIAPDLPVLFMSGYAEEQLRREIDIENMYFIPKPFSVQQISNKVAEVLTASARGKPL